MSETTMEVVKSLESRLVARTQCTNDEAVEYLTVAKSILMARLYPYKEEYPLDLPNKYLEHQLNIAEYLINKRGAEGQISHTENGIGRAYESSMIPEPFFVGVIPYGKIL